MSRFPQSWGVVKLAWSHTSLINQKPKRSWKPTQTQIRASEAARAEADREATRISWPQLLRARREYIRWQAYALWVRCIEETEGGFPSWLAETVEKRARGYLRYAADYRLHHSSAPRPNTAWRSLELWVSEQIFRKPHAEGWMTAVGYYAVKDLGSLRDDAYSEWCIENWKQQKPRPYPAFGVWRRASEQVSEEILDQVEMRDDRRKLIKHMTRVSPRSLDIAVEKYVEWLVFALWARAALERPRQLPPGMERELRMRCPGFLERNTAALESAPTFDALMKWVEDRQFDRAKREGWLDVLSYAADLHPRRSRAKDYWVNWEHDWTVGGRLRYPSFRAWTRALDRYMFALEDSGSVPQNLSCVE